MSSTETELPEPYTEPHAALTAERPTQNQFALLKQRRFAPFFWTQFLGAGNDNIFKFAFTVLATYQAAAVAENKTNGAMNSPPINGPASFGSSPPHAAA